MAENPPAPADSAVPDDLPAPGPAAEALWMTAPAVAFMAVAVADGSLDRAEVGRFRRQLSCGDGAGEAFAAALDRLAASDRTLDAAVEAASAVAVDGPAAVADHLRAVRAVLDRDRPADAGRFAEDLLTFARGIAEAAAGLHGVGPKVSDAERAMLDRIAAAVGAG